MDKHKRRSLFRMVKYGVSVLVCSAVAWSAWKAFTQLDGQLDGKDFRWSDFDFRLVLLCTVTYFAAMSSGWLYWHYVLVAMQQRPRMEKSFRAFFYSQLAKYVPGKAMAVIVRTASVSDERVKPGVAVVSVFVETLTWISVASFIAMLTMSVNFGTAGLESGQFIEQRWKFVCILLLCLTLIPTFPPTCRRLVSIFSSRKLGSIKHEIFAGINFRTWGTGWLIFSAGWCFNATSLWLMLNAVPGSEASPGHWPLCLAAVSLATVVGFASFLPGGLGVRELVMIPLLAPVFGTTQALVAVISLRLVYLSTEVLAALLVRIYHSFRCRLEMPADRVN